VSAASSLGSVDSGLRFLNIGKGGFRLDGILVQIPEAGGRFFQLAASAVNLNIASILSVFGQNANVIA
jgi:hypothetical protein